MKDLIEQLQHTKLFGMEDFWYTGAMIVDGIELRKSGSDTYVYVYDPNPSESTPSDGYISTEYKVSAALSDNFIKDVAGGNILGFFPTSTTGGSATTYFCDNGRITLSDKRMVVCNGWKNRSTKAGIFSTDFNWGTTETNAVFGTRLCAWKYDEF